MSHSVGGPDVALALCPTWTADKPPIGLGALAAHLSRAGIRVQVHDFNVRLYRQIEVEQPAWKDIWGTGAWQIWQDYFFFPLLFPGRFPYADPVYGELQPVLDEAASRVAATILESPPRAVGFSVMANTTLLSLMAAREVKRRAPEVAVIFGGPNCQEGTNEEFFLRSGWVDAVAVGEGEETLLELCGRLREAGRLDAVPGSAVRMGDEIVRGARRGPIRDLDSLAVPDYRGFAGEGYILGFEELAVEFSRGCVGRCDFCFDKPYWGGYRTHSGPGGAAQLAELGRRHGTRRFFFADLTLTSLPARVEDLCDAILANGLDVRWGGNARVHDGLTDALLAKMKRAGCEFLHYGLEHVSSRVLDAMGKGCAKGQYVEALERAARAGITVTVGFIVGHPSETEEDFEELLSFVAEHHDLIHQIHANDLALIRGSPLYAARSDRGIVPGHRMELPDDLAWARTYTYPFDSEWRTADGGNTRASREERLGRLRRLMSALGQEQSWHGKGRDGFYEAEPRGTGRPGDGTDGIAKG